MINFLILASLFVLFQFLGKAADLIITNIKSICQKLGVKIFFLGIILGFFTSTPELAIGFNAISKNIQEIPLGNLLGGIIVLFGLFLGLSMIVERRITTDGKIHSFLPITIYLAIPFILGLDGEISVFDGTTLIIGYLFLIGLSYLKNKNFEDGRSVQMSREDFLKKLGLIVLGIFLVAVLSNLIINLTLILIKNVKIPLFILGVLIFSIGTNLPEIIITIRSWRRHIKELSLSVLTGSVIANPAIIGLFALIKPISFKTDSTYYVLMAFTFIMLAALLRFYETGRTLTRREGIILVAIYGLFLLTQMLFLVY